MERKVRSSVLHFNFGLSVYYLQKKRYALLKSEVKISACSQHKERKRYIGLAEWTIENKRTSKDERRGAIDFKGKEAECMWNKTNKSDTSLNQQGK